MYPKPYIAYLSHFHGSRDYFECHEIMEEYWLEQNRETKWLALIQLAVALYHERQKNFNGSLKLFQKVLAHIEGDDEIFEGLSIDTEKLVEAIRHRIKNVSNQDPYRPFNIPFTDKKLIKLCLAFSKEENWEWNREESNSEKELINKHRIRDRSEVIKAREEAWLARRIERGEMKLRFYE